jgi:hypothetical protein
MAWPKGLTHLLEDTVKTKRGLMKSGRVGWFCVGVVVTLGAIGAVSYASAQGDATIKVCANKSSGVMRLLTKGTCRKNETSLSWNKLGPQGLAGEKGETGSAGPKGDAGAAGPKGDSGTSGQNLFAIDAAGVTLGPVRGLDGSVATVEIAGLLWHLDLQLPYFWSDQGSSGFYQDPSCTNPYIVLNAGARPSSQLVTIDYGADSDYQASDKAYQISGSAMTFSGRAVYVGQINTSTNLPECLALTQSQKTNYDVRNRIYSGTEIQKPSYETPVSIVSR